MSFKQLSSFMVEFDRIKGMRMGNLLSEHFHKILKL